MNLKTDEKLWRARRGRSESRSETELRAHGPDESTTGGELLARYREHGPFFIEEELARVEELKRLDRPPVDKAGR